MLRGNGFEGEIVSFEPVVESFDELHAAAVADPHWSIQRLALADHDGRSEIGVAASRNFSSLLPVSDFGSRLVGSPVAVERREPVELRRLDGLWEELVPAGGGLMLKIDTQGYDWQVIEGAGARLSEVAALHIEAPVQEIYQGTVGWLDLLTC